jgi:uncharacterized repeat protein (TIGR01451 family)
MRVLLAFGLLAAGFAPSAHAVGALAGAQIQNTAQVNYTIGTTPATQNSNTVTLTVNEILDVVTTVQSGDVPVTPGGTNQVVVIRVTNTGNGSETFRLTVNSALPGDDFDPTPSAPAMYFDNDNSGTVTPGDTVYNPGANDPTLAPDAFINLLVLNDIGAPLANGARGFTRLTAESVTALNSPGALGTPGTAIAGQGTGGTDAVVGTSGADAFATGTYLVADIAIAANKTATVSDPFGGTRPMPGATIVYQVVVTATGTGTANGALFSDAIPANTTYVAASLRLNGNALTDAGDADAGQFVAAPSPRVNVNLGNLTQASGPQTIRFSVLIN